MNNRFGVSKAQQARIDTPIGTVRFPYTPTVTQGATANYNNYDVTHTNFAFPAYQRSEPTDVTIDALFTADTDEMFNLMFEARRICKAVTRMDFNGSGSPPPVVKFSYLGPNAFNNVPCLMTNWNMTYQADIDYINAPSSRDWLPVESNFTITLKPVYSPQKQANQWNFGAFAGGALTRRGWL